MNQRNIDKLVQAATGIVAIIVLGYLISDGTLGVEETLPLILTILAGAGLIEGGRRIPHNRE